MTFNRGVIENIRGEQNAILKTYIIGQVDVLFAALIRSSFALSTT